MEFHQYRSGLHYYDTEHDQITNGNKNSKNTKILTKVIDYSFLKTIADNKRFFTRRKIDEADQSLRLCKILGRPSYTKYIKVLDRHLIQNCLVSAEHAKRALFIYGPDISILKEKRVQSKTEYVTNFHPVSIPKQIIGFHNNTTLCCGHLFVQGISFFTPVIYGQSWSYPCRFGFLFSNVIQHFFLLV